MIKTVITLTIFLALSTAACGTKFRVGSGENKEKDITRLKRPDQDLLVTTIEEEKNPKKNVLYGEKLSLLEGRFLYTAPENQTIKIISKGLTFKECGWGSQKFKAVRVTLKDKEKEVAETSEVLTLPVTFSLTAEEALILDFELKSSIICEVYRFEFIAQIEP